MDDKQQELIRDNLELKELCLYLDEERSNNSNPRNACQHCGTTMNGAVNGVNGVRDDGDGSSSSTNADETLPQINGQYSRVMQVWYCVTRDVTNRYTCFFPLRTSTRAPC